MQFGIATIPIDTWLLVTPQIIARIHSPTTLVRRSVHILLDRVAKAHPQGLIYPLTVASKSQSQSRLSVFFGDVRRARRTFARAHYPWRCAACKANRRVWTLPVGWPVVAEVAKNVRSRIAQFILEEVRRSGA